MTMTEERKARHNWSGPRLPVTARHVTECFRCAEDRRVLRPYAVGRTGRTWEMLLCDPCAATLLPTWLDPDPLTLPETG